MTQAKYIEDLLVELLQRYDPTLNIDPASDLYVEVIKPVADALAIDPSSTDAEEFIMARLKEAHPALSLQPGDAIVDLLVRPMQTLLEGYRRELEIIKRGQNLSDISLLTLEQAEDLASNFYVTRREGQVSFGTVRIFFSNPVYVSVTKAAEFSTSTGLIFRPARAFNITPQSMINQRSGRLYFVDIPVEAAEPGEEYNVDAGAITTVTGLNGPVRVINQFPFTGGIEGENAAELLTRAGYSLSERSLNTRRGIRAQILETFKGVRTLQVVGYGDPEMKRDILTGTSNGKLMASGISLVAGSYLFMISMYEDNGALGNEYAKAGNRIDLNFSKLFYDIDDKVQTFFIEEVIYSSEGSLTNTPTVYILKLDRAPNVLVPNVSSSTNLIPGVLPGVFASIFGDPEIQISTGPDLIQEIVTQEVAVGGKIDLMVQPSQVSTVDSGLSGSQSESADLETLGLSTSGTVPDSLLIHAKKNIVASNYVLVFAGASGLGVGDAIEGQTSGARAVVSSKNGTGTRLTLSTFNGVNFQEGETVSSILAGTSSVISSIEFDDLESIGVKPRTCLHILSGVDTGLYIVIYVEGPFAYLDTELTASSIDLAARFVSKAKINVFNPITRKYPFPEGNASGLQTTIGLAQVEVAEDLRALGILVGDTMELLDGPNKGVYTIVSFGAQGGKFPVLSTTMSATDSNVNYIVYKESAGLESPLVRILPGGLTSSGNVIPYGLPVGAFPREGVSGSKTEYFGVNGFVLPDPGTEWAPSSNTYARTDFSESQVAYMDSMNNGKGIVSCVSDECTDSGDDIVCRMTLVSAVSGNIQLYLEGAMSSDGKDYLTTLRTYFSDLVDALGLGASFSSFIDLLAPVHLGPPPGNAVPLRHYEILLPREIFDSYNNTFVAIPEFNWQAEFDSVNTFEEALDKLNNGTMLANQPALSHAKAGDCFTIPSGPNAGSYRIAKIYNIDLYLGSTVLLSQNAISGIDHDKAYIATIVVVEGEFPHKPAMGLSDFFEDGITTPSLPTIPTINVQSIATVSDSVYTAGDVLSPFEVVQTSFTWLFQFLHQIGFDVPNLIDIDAGPTLQKIVQKLFFKYYTGKQSCPQDIRFLFQDPCELEVTGSRSSRSFSWNEEAKTTAKVYSRDFSATINPILGTLGSLTDVTALVKASESAEVVELTATIDINEMHTIWSTQGGFTGVAPYLQGLLDPAADYVSVEESSQGILKFEVLEGGEGSSILVSTNAGGNLLAGDEQFAAGSSAAGNSRSAILPPLNPTTLVTTVSQTTLEYAAMLDETEFISVVPAGEEVAVADYPRDLLLSSGYSGSTVSTASSLADEDSWFKLGVRVGDEVHLHEQKNILDPAGISQSDMYVKSDRVLLISTAKSSSKVSLLGTPTHGFTSPESGDDSDVVVSGDILVIEEGPSKGAYTIDQVHNTYLVLKSPAKSNNYGTFAKYGEAAVISAGSSLVDLGSGTVTADDVGRFITLFASPHSDTDGSYEILSVSSGVVELDTDAFVYDSSAYWAITVNNLDTPGESVVEGRTSSLAGYAFRIYSGIPKVLPILEISKHLSRLKESMTLYHGTTGHPSVLKNQPYRIVRTHSKKLSVDDVRGNTDMGLFYADIPCTAITPDLVSNIPGHTALIPILSSFTCRGYTLYTIDENLSFSPKEECYLIADAVQASSSGDFIIETLPMSASIDLGLEVSAIQGYMDSKDNRILCADPLVRAFCPSYVYFTVVTSGGANSLDAATLIKGYIDSLEPEDSLILSELEKYLHQKGISNYQHPIHMVVLTHDIDRKIVMSMSEDRIDDATLSTKVTNRTTYFVTGDARTSSRSDGVESISVIGGL